MSEYLLVFKKPGLPIFKNASKEKKIESKTNIGTLFTNEMANNVWHIAPVPPGLLSHPCPYPEEIPYRFISLYSYRGDTVLDPFLGSGQTAKVAVALGRNAIGYDVEEKYVEYAHSRMGEPSAVRKNQLVAVFTKIPLNAPLGFLKSQNNDKT